MKPYRIGTAFHVFSGKARVYTQRRRRANSDWQNGVCVL